MKARKIVYAASLDPITNGHLNVIERVAKLCDELIVMVAVDSRKNYTFDAEERVALARVAVNHLSNVTVSMCVNRYVVKYAEELEATIIVRGIRNSTDLEGEQVIAEENHAICPNIETIFIPCRPDLTHVSSSMVKAHVGADPGWEKEVARSVPAAVVHALKEKFILKKARAHWEKLMKALENPKGSDAIFNNLVMRYSEPHRKYHTLEHIVKMLDELDHLNSYAYHFISVALAIWFHDAIYEPMAKDNEEKSAELAKDAINNMKLHSSLVDEVAALIMATKHIAPPSDPNAKILIDLDLMILGAQPDEFDNYEVGIYEEYKDHYSEKDFANGRSKILQSFLSRTTIYTTPHFYKKYEKTAQTNLARSIGKLKQK